MQQRVQLIFDKDLTLDLKEIAGYKGTSMSQLVRQYVAPAVKLDKKKIKKVSNEGVKAMLDMAKMAEKLSLRGSRDSSTNDDYIYR